MKSCRAIAISAFFAIWMTACGTPNKQTEPIRPGEVVTYYDRNGDGIVDLENHRFPGGGDMDWELRDDDFDGRFEVLRGFGFAWTEKPVNLPVPTNVKIAPEKSHPRH